MSGLGKKGPMLAVSGDGRGAALDQLSKAALIDLVCDLAARNGGRLFDEPPSWEVLTQVVEPVLLVRGDRVPPRFRS